MNLSVSSLTFTLGGLMFLLCGSVCMAQKESSVTPDTETNLSGLEFKAKQLQIQNENLAKALIHAREQEESAKNKLTKIQLELEALNLYPLGSDDQRLVEAVANRKVLDAQLSALERATRDLIIQVREYVKHAIVTSDQERISLESKLRDVDLLIGLREKPQPQIDTGSLQQASIVAIDAESGVLVLNAGQKQQVQTGMTFNILRGKSQIAEARIAEVRPAVAGALITRLNDINNKVRLGDTASIKIQ